MGIKARLWRGPLDGKVMDIPYLRERERFRGGRKMSRRQRYEWEQEQFRNHDYGYSFPMRPLVEAEYEPVIELQQVASGELVRVYLRHPDGSYFFKYTGKKREFEG